uniref:F-box domain-containing protein n=1 Tax=Oryza rufipogon TaxID=4529 RepID=A0A0E0RI31_ORYRU
MAVDEEDVAVAPVVLEEAVDEELELPPAAAVAEEEEEDDDDEVVEAFRALTDFTLCRAKINAYDNDDLRLGHLLSSRCCPRLRRLKLRHVAGLIRLHLDAAGTLEELRLVYLPDLLCLHVDAPGLRLLRVGHCDHLPLSDDPALARVSAPRLEALAWDGLEHIACREVVVATATVRRLKKISLLSHDGDGDQTNVAAVRLLKSCTAVDHLELRLTVRVLHNSIIDTKLQLPSEDTVKKDIPHLPTVSKLRLDVNTWWHGHTIGVTLARIIERCNNIENISIRVRGLWEVCSDAQCNCSQPKGWEDQKIQLDNLKRAEFKGFIPFDDRKSLLRLLLKNAPALEKITMNDTTTTSPAAPAPAAVDDLISELDDAVLLHILSFLPSAGDVARTTVLSRRWRHLCGIAPCLRFAVGLGSFAEDDDEDEEEHGARCHDAARRLIAGADACLARRRHAAAAGVHDALRALEISLVYGDADNDSSWYKREPYIHDHHHEADITPSLVDSWLRFAECHVTGSFVLELPLNAAAAAKQDQEEADEAKRDVAPPVEEGEAVVVEEEELDLLPAAEEEAVELPATARATAMSLTLCDANTVVPIASAGAFRALTDFTLCRAKINAYDNDDLRLGHLLSSPCCPRLRRLELRHVAGLIRLRLDAVAGTLEELRLVYLPDLRRLHVDAPGLRLLRVGHCDNLPYSDDPGAARVSAPRLETLAWDGLEYRACREFIATPTVRHLKKLSLYSHGGADDETNVAAVRLLKSCTAVDHLELRLTVRVLPAEDTVKDIPHLPTVTKLRLDVNTWWYGHTIGATLARIIAKCNNIEHLSILVRGLLEVCSDAQCKCSQPKGWEDQKIQLEHLKKVEFKGFIPFDDRKRLLRLLLENVPALEKITMEFDPSYIFENPKEVRDKIDFDMPDYQGSWTPCDWDFHECGFFDGATKYEWTREKPTDGI